VGAANLRHFLLFLSYLVAGTGYGVALGLLLGWRERGALWRHTHRVLQAGCCGRIAGGCLPAACCAAGCAARGPGAGQPGPVVEPFMPRVFDPPLLPPCLPMQATQGMHPLSRVLSFSLRWLLAAPSWLALWAFFTFGEWQARDRADAAPGAICWGRWRQCRIHHVPHDCLSHAAVCWATFVSVGLLLGRQARLLARGHSYIDSLQLSGREGQEAVPTAALAADVPLLPDEAAEGAAADVTTSVWPPMRHLRRVFGRGHPLTWLLPAWRVDETPANRRLKVN
jgi:hypothetical protein